MKSSLSVRSWWEPLPETQGVAVAFDIFRCTTTIHTLAHRGEGPVWVAPSLKEVIDDPRLREMRVFSELSQDVRCRERYDNSPFLAAEKPWPKGVPSLVATTSGTPALFAGRHFEQVFVGSLVNFSALVQHLSALGKPVTLLPAALPGSNHVEDEIAAFGVATALEGFVNLPDFVRQCGQQAVEKILASHRPAELIAKISTAAQDVRLATQLDAFDQVLALEFTEEKFARVVKVSG